MPLTIVTHNLFWLQGAPFEGTDPGAARPEILAGLAECYRPLEPDVVCVQELQSESAFSQFANALERDGFYCAGNAHRAYGGAILFRHGRFVAQSVQTAIAAERFWMKIELTAGAWDGLIVANAHLPSGRQTSPDEARRRRLDELTALVSHLPRPDVVTGDFNEPPGGSAHELMTSLGYIDAALPSGAGAIGTNAAGQNRRIDYIWLDRKLAPALAGYEVLLAERLADPSGKKKFLSDHLPVIARLKSVEPRS